MAVQLPDSDSDRHTCDFCEAHVTAEFRRIYGTAECSLHNRAWERCATSGIDF